MRGFIANTDHAWYEFLGHRESLAEVNFRPSMESLRWHNESRFLG